jgi:hypothetical protein
MRRTLSGQKSRPFATPHLCITDLMTARKSLGRDNTEMAAAVNSAVALFLNGHTAAALHTLKKARVPMSVVERVVLRRGRWRKGGSKSAGSPGGAPGRATPLPNPPPKV